MADLSRRNFLIGGGALALTSVFAAQAAAQPLFHADAVAKDLMSAPPEAWDQNAVNALTPDQRQAVIQQIKTLQHNVEYKTKLRVTMAKEEARGPSLQEKVQAALEVTMAQIEGVQQQHLANLAQARCAAADAAALAAMYPGSRYLARQAYASGQQADAMALDMWRNAPQVNANTQQRIDSTVRGVVEAEVVRDAYHDPMMVFAPEEARAIPGMIRNREMSPQEGKVKAMGAVKAWYDRAVGILDGSVPMPQATRQNDGFQPPDGYQPPAGYQPPTGYQP